MPGWRSGRLLAPPTGRDPAIGDGACWILSVGIRGRENSTRSLNPWERSQGKTQSNPRRRQTLQGARAAGIRGLRLGVELKMKPCLLRAPPG